MAKQIDADTTEIIGTLSASFFANHVANPFFESGSKLAPRAIDTGKQVEWPITTRAGHR